MKRLIFTIILLAFTQLFTKAQSVSINSTGVAADTSSILDIASTSKGILIPRMTQAQRTAITLVATGLLVYQTDGARGFYYYNGTTWLPLLASGDAITSLNGLTTTTQTLSTPGTAGTAPAWSSSGSTHTLNIPISSNAGVTAGLLSNTDWNTFNNKLSTSTGWTTTGNTGTSAANNFIGTTDAIDFLTKTNSTERMRVTSAGNIGIGTNAPATLLHMQSTGNQLRLGYDATNYSDLNTNSSGNLQVIPTGGTTNVTGRLTSSHLGVGVTTIAASLLAEFKAGHVGLTNTGTASEIRLFEPSGSGTQYTAIKAQAQAANLTYTLPATQGLPGSRLQNDGTGLLTWSNPNQEYAATFVRKPVNESVVNSSTLQDDDDFIFAMSSNSTFEITMMLKVRCSNGGKLKLQMVAPTGSTAFLGALTTRGGSNAVVYIPNTITAYNIPAGALDENTDVVLIQGTITTAGTAGTFKMQWSQNSADGSPTIIYAGSYCKAIRMQ